MPLPLQYFLVALGAALLLLLAIILVRTLSFRPRAGVTPSDESISFDGDRAIENLRALVRCKTVSRYTHDEEDDGEFRRLLELLPTLYPNVFATCTYRELPDRAILFHWKGSGEGDPAVLMAHYDVVPVDPAGWTRPPFDAVMEDGVIWGRGTLDTKVTFGSALFAVDHLIAEGFVPTRDVYLAFSGGEEVNGPGATHIVDLFEQEGIRPSLVLDEGGAVVEGVFPGVSAPCGMIGIAEKGMMDVAYETKSQGGHASAPKPHTPVGILARACCRVENDPFPSHLTRPVSEMFDTLGRHSSFLYRMIFANLWCFSPVLDLICKKSGGELNALMRTTVAFTRMQGSQASNVIPPEASMVSNIRLNPQDRMESALARLKKTVGDDTVTFRVIQGMDPSRISETKCEGYDIVARAVASTWRGAIVSPYLMVQCSDSRHWGRISDRVYRFSAMDLTSAERATIHGNDEHIRVETVLRAAEFYIRLLRDC